VKKLLATLLCAASLAAAREPLRVADVDARLRAAPQDERVKATVLLFISHDCPISNALAPEMNRIVGKYSPLGVAFFFVYAEGALADADAARHAQEFALAAPVTVDEKCVLVARAGAKVTPEAVVFSHAGEVVYRGRINDLFAAFGKRRATPETHDLRDALDAILAGKAPPSATTPAIGCFIPTKS
jgi:hypothetical protein